MFKKKKKKNFNFDPLIFSGDYFQPIAGTYGELKNPYAKIIKDRYQDLEVGDVVEVFSKLNNGNVIAYYTNKENAEVINILNKNDFMYI